MNIRYPIYEGVYRILTVMSLSLVLLGVDVVMDATLQLVRKDDGALIEILGVKPVA